MIEAASKFDLVLTEHLRRIQCEETQNKYLHKDIQNEWTNILSSNIRKLIIKKIQVAKYYSLIVDCTPDASRTEQLSLTVRILEKQGEIFQAKEYFLGFLIAKESTGVSLTELVLSELKNLNIPIENCRGQGYDNGANMKGKNCGMQSRIRALEPRAFYVPCSSHSLNLVISDAVQCSSIAIDFFDTIESVYTYFSSSTNRLQVLKNKLKNLSLKPLCTTRWESRIDCVKPFVHYLENIEDALLEMCENEDPKSRHMAECLSNKIFNFQFICCTLIWYDILQKINICSKYLQSVDICLQTAVELLDSTKKFLIDLRSNEKFLCVLDRTKSIATPLGVPDDFPAISQNRIRKKRKVFSYEGTDEPVTNPTEKFKIEFYFKILDQAISSISERFDQIKEHNSIFQFLYHIRDFNINPTLITRVTCINLEKTLTHNSQ